jgi:uncharacterized protein (DUF2235 family)
VRRFGRRFGLDLRVAVSHLQALHRSGSATPPMAKNIVLCCDGTANEFAKDLTNVVKLYSCLLHDSPEQVTYCHPGIGTMEPFGALSL